tara:strand:- start:2401 stop:2754 length:354 start_codon:yes stop_codon:yes gene_type:complete
MALNKNQILEAIDAKTIEFEVPEWGGSILLRGMTGKARNDYEFWASSQNKSDVADFRGIRERLIISCAVDESGEPLFSINEIDDLAAKNSEIIDRLHAKCQEICGMAADSVEDAEKN